MPSKSVPSMGKATCEDKFDRKYSCQRHKRTQIRQEKRKNVKAYRRMLKKEDELSMPDERKPVICPWCGWEMVAREGQDIFHGKYNAYVCEGCEAVSPIAYSEDAAYAAATRTPPNRPLTRAQVAEKDGYDAVWRVNKMSGYLYRPMSAKDVRELIACESVNYCENLWYFARKPTSADIEAARKEADCK